MTNPASAPTGFHANAASAFPTRGDTTSALRPPSSTFPFRVGATSSTGARVNTSASMGARVVTTTSTACRVDTTSVVELILRSPNLAIRSHPLFPLLQDINVILQVTAVQDTLKIGQKYSTVPQTQERVSERASKLVIAAECASEASK